MVQENVSWSITKGVGVVDDRNRASDQRGRLIELLDRRGAEQLVLDLGDQPGLVSRRRPHPRQPRRAAYRVRDRHPDGDRVLTTDNESQRLIAEELPARCGRTSGAVVRAAAPADDTWHADRGRGRRRAAPAPGPPAAAGDSPVPCSGSGVGPAAHRDPRHRHAGADRAGAGCCGHRRSRSASAPNPGGPRRRRVADDGQAPAPDAGTDRSPGAGGGLCSPARNDHQHQPHGRLRRARRRRGRSSTATGGFWRSRRHSWMATSGWPAVVGGFRRGLCRVTAGKRVRSAQEWKNHHQGEVASYAGGIPAPRPRPTIRSSTVRPSRGTPPVRGRRSRTRAADRVRPRGVSARSGVAGRRCRWPTPSRPLATVGRSPVPRRPRRRSREAATIGACSTQTVGQVADDRHRPGGHDRWQLPRAHDRRRSAMSRPVPGLARDRFGVMNGNTSVQRGAGTASPSGRNRLNYPGRVRWLAALSWQDEHDRGGRPGPGEPDVPKASCAG